MKNKSLLSLFVFLVCGLFTIIQPAYCKDQTPEELVRNFYTWYFGELSKFGNLPELDNNVYKYIYPCLVNKLRIEYKTGSRDFNYFTYGNDYWPELSNYITTGAAVKINDEVSIVPLGFGETKERSVPNLIVFVQREKDTLYITKVESASTPY